MNSSVLMKVSFNVPYLDSSNFLAVLGKMPDGDDETEIQAEVENEESEENGEFDENEESYNDYMEG